ncbi:MAG TPA: hypothetical protein PK644_08190, partial [bacterium]|nr:hypothetical protein [bacterium]
AITRQPSGTISLMVISPGALVGVMCSLTVTRWPGLKSGGNFLMAVKHWPRVKLRNTSDAASLINITGCFKLASDL